MLRIEFNGRTYDWVNLQDVGEAVREPAFVTTLKDNIAHYFGVPKEYQVVFDADGFLSNDVDFTRALQNWQPLLNVYDLRDMPNHLRKKVRNDLNSLNNEMGKFSRTLGRQGGTSEAKEFLSLSDPEEFIAVLGLFDMHWALNEIKARDWKSFIIKRPQSSFYASFALEECLKNPSYLGDFLSEAADSTPILMLQEVVGLSSPVICLAAAPSPQWLLEQVRARSWTSFRIKHPLTGTFTTFSIEDCERDPYPLLQFIHLNVGSELLVQEVFSTVGGSTTATTPSSGSLESKLDAYRSNAAGLAASGMYAGDQQLYSSFEGQRSLWSPLQDPLQVSSLFAHPQAGSELEKQSRARLPSPQPGLPSDPGGMMGGSQPGSLSSWAPVSPLFTAPPGATNGMPPVAGNSTPPRMPFAYPLSPNLSGAQLTISPRLMPVLASPMMPQLNPHPAFQTQQQLMPQHPSLMASAPDAHAAGSRPTTPRQEQPTPNQQPRQSVSTFMPPGGPQTDVRRMSIGPQQGQLPGPPMSGLFMPRPLMPPGPAGSASALPPGNQPRMDAFEVFLVKDPSGSGKFGFANTPNEAMDRLTISWLDDDGLLAHWNKSFPERSVGIGDRLVSVNGVAGDIEKVRAEFEKKGVVMLIEKANAS